MLVLLACTLVHLYRLCYGFVFGALGHWPVGTVLLVALPVLALLFFLTYQSIHKVNRLRSESLALAAKNEQLSKSIQKQDQVINDLEETNYKLVELDHFKQGFTQMIHSMRSLGFRLDN